MCRDYFCEKSAINHYCGIATNTWFRYLTSETGKYKNTSMLRSAVRHYVERYLRAPPMRSA